MAHARALRVFRVAHAGICLRVRLLPTTAAVDQEYREGKRRRGPHQVRAFFRSSPSGSVLGTIVLGLDGRLEEEIPHEVFHAVLHHQRMVHAENDEPAAYAVGILSAKIFKGVRPYAARANSQ